MRTFKEIAEELGISEEAVKTAYKRGMRKLRRERHESLLELHTLYASVRSQSPERCYSAPAAGGFHAD